MPNAITYTSAVSTNISILQAANEQFATTQKRVSTGKFVFSAADDASRYRLSETSLSRSRQIDALNNNVSLGLANLDTTDKTLKNIVGLVESAQDLARRAQAEGASGLRSTQTTANINAATAVAGYAVGARLSITSDNGQNFTYTFTTAGVTWGTVVDALNSANIGVQADFIPSTTAGQTNLRFQSTNSRDFTFDAISDQTVVDDLVGLTSPATGLPALTAANAANLFGAAGVVGANETGFTIGYGGALVGNKAGGITGASVIAAGSTLVFTDGNGATRTLSYAAASTVGQVLTDINNLNSGVRAELVNQTAAGAGPLQLRIRNTNGGNIQFVAGTGEFANGGNLGLTVPSTAYATPLSNNNALRLAYGVQYDAIIANINLQVQNNPVQAGRNLLTGQNLAIVLDEFSGAPVTITGVNITAAGTLTLAQGGSTWTTDVNIQTSNTQLNQALLNLRTYQAQFGAFTSYIKGRYDLNKSASSDFKTSGDELVAADSAEESANLVALQTRQQFAVQAFSLGSQNQQGLLRLLQ